MKTISVVMCTYNGAEFIREQLDSIINQTYPIHELIVQDDCSTDDTVAIIKEYMKKYSFIKLYVNEHNLGFNQNFKSAAMKATGDYVAISDQDDVWFPEKIASQINNIGNNTICCSYYLFGSNLKTAPVMEKEIGAERVLFTSILGHTMLCRRDFIQKENSWLSHIWYDWGLAINAYLENGVTIIRKPLSWHRHHEHEVSYTSNKSYKSYMPYLLGYNCFRDNQKTTTWKYVYSYIHDRTNKHKLPLVHRISGLLLKKDLFSFLHLCIVCLKNSNLIYPNKEIGKGVMLYVRAFCYPLFWSCSNKHYYRYFD